MTGTFTTFLRENVHRTPAIREGCRLLRWPIARRSRDAALSAQGYAVVEREAVLGIR